jgi:hypothetical protein
MTQRFFACQKGNIMTPLEALSKWFKEQDVEVQKDASLLVSMYLFDEMSLPDWKSPVPKVLAWLDVSDLPRYAIVGRVIRFRACFEHTCARRFKPEGWATTDRVFRSVIAKGASDSGSDEAKIAAQAFPMLRALPERIEKWGKVGLSWEKLLDEHLSDEALEQW